MKKINTKGSKKINAVIFAAVATMVMGMCVGCGSNAKVEENAAATETQEAKADENASVTESQETKAEDAVPADENVVSEETTEAVEATADESATDAEELENPGAFDTDSWSISYDTESWYGFMEEDGTVVINNLNAVAGSSYIEITEADFKTVDEAVAMLEETKGKKLTAPEKIEIGETECFITYDEDGVYGTGLYIFDFYRIYEHNGKVIIVDESITHDDDDSRAEALSYEFDDVVNTLVLK